MLPFKVLKKKPGTKRKSKSISPKATCLPSSVIEESLNVKEKRTELNPCYCVNIEGIFSGGISSALQIPLFELKIQADFSSSIDGFIEGTLDLNEHLIPPNSSIFFVRVIGDSMTGNGVFPGDLLVVNRTLSPSDGKLVVAVLNGKMIVKRFEKEKNAEFLYSENNKCPGIKVDEDDDSLVWGIVTNIIHTLP